MPLLNLLTLNHFRHTRSLDEAFLERSRRRRQSRRARAADARRS
jgi:hypothetical protein